MSWLRLERTQGGNHRATPASIQPVWSQHWGGARPGLTTSQSLTILPAGRYLRGGHTTVSTSIQLVRVSSVAAKCPMRHYGLGDTGMTTRWEILQIAFNLASGAIMKPNNFNSELATYGLQIFVGVAAREQEIGAAQVVLDALDKLSPISQEDRRSRIWQDHKLLVQEAFVASRAFTTKLGISRHSDRIADNADKL